MRVVTAEGPKEMRALWWSGGTIEFIDQRLLPGRLDLFTASGLEEVSFAIKDMVVRGAPAIGVAAAYGMAQAESQGRDLDESAETLRNTRPTAHDLFYAVDFYLREVGLGKEALAVAEGYADSIVEKCRQIGLAGEPLIGYGAKVLTHCNAGALATVDWGTALAPIRMAHRVGKEIFVYVDETRPRLQGAKLTAWELSQEAVGCAIIADNAAGHYMSRGEVDLVITGADRITANGDFANKIGTYEKAVLAAENGVPFYVAAPVSTFDFSMDDGKDIPIELRTEEEVLALGGVRIGPEGVPALNPAFDVTPSKFVAGFITEAGVLKPSDISKLNLCD